MMYLVSVMIGLAAGVLGGMIGIGGGIIMIPALSFFLKFEQHLAQGTTLAAMIPPIGILAAYEYYKKGYVNIPVAGFIALGFIIGALFGAKIAVDVDEGTLSRIFGVALLMVSLKMIFWK